MYTVRRNNCGFVASLRRHLLLECTQLPFCFEFDIVANVTLALKI